MECKNCGAHLEDEAGFCSYCGARVIRDRISFNFLFKEFMDKVLNVDNRLLKTFLHLFYKPDVVINSYINGVRKRYFNPVSYLIISITINGLYLYFLKDILVETFTIESPTSAFDNAEYTSNFMDVFSEYQAIFTVMNIPIYAFLSWLVFLNKKKYNFYEHIVLFLYAASHVTFFSFILVFPFYFVSAELTAKVSVVMSVLTFVYFAFVLIRLFKLTFLQFIIKTLYFIFLSVFLFVFLGIAMNVFLFLYLGKDQYLKQFAPQAIPKKDSIINVQPKDSLKTIQHNDSIQMKTDAKDISFYEASSRLNCLS
jgi:hypothetical protein